MTQPDPPYRAELGLLFLSIALPTLSYQISDKERADCELFYLSHISKHGPSDEDAKCREHPQWQLLCASASISLSISSPTPVSLRPMGPETDARLSKVHVLPLPFSGSVSQSLLFLNTLTLRNHMANSSFAQSTADPIPHLHSKRNRTPLVIVSLVSNSPSGQQFQSLLLTPRR